MKTLTPASERRLLVLYMNTDSCKQTYCIYGNEKEADSEGKLHMKGGDLEAGRFWISFQEQPGYLILPETAKADP